MFPEHRDLTSYVYSYYDAFNLFNNITEAFRNATQLVPPGDVEVDTVLTSLVLNTIVFVLLMGFYECLRRILPAVYSSQKRLDRIHLDVNHTSTVSSSTVLLPESPDVMMSPNIGNNASTTTPYQEFAASQHQDFPSIDSVPSDLRHSILTPLPEAKPLDWILPVYGVPWNKVRRIAGLDGYFFLRYIRMNVRITAVSTIWFFAILVPIYAYGGSNATGWYHFSAKNLPTNGYSIWAPCVFLYLFSAFVMFVIKQEYRHFLEIRQDFLAKGSAHVNPQHHYSLLIENIPYELRSDTALQEYFDQLFPGKVHSASVVLNLPDLEDASARCLRTCRRLEKSIAYLHATKSRPTHIVGRGRLNLLGVDLAPLDLGSCGNGATPVYVEDGRYAERPERGTRVDSISYYTQELAADSRTLFKMQQRKLRIAESGNLQLVADNWLEQASRNFNQVANRIINDSEEDNDLLTPQDSFDYVYPNTESMRAGRVASGYGSFGTSPTTASPSPPFWASPTPSVPPAPPSEPPLPETMDDRDYAAPFSADQYKSWVRRIAGRLGLDFVVAGIKAIHNQLDVALEGVISATMSSTGFVTFLDLASTTCAASAPLSVKSNVLMASVAPEPREIRWQNAHVSRKTQLRREYIVNALLFVGVIFWSFPLAFIQAFAKADNLAMIPGLEWINTFHGGKLKNFVNGYLPVVALLGLILILPIVFEYVAIKIEHRKTFSDVQASMLGRYFYYQLANVYISATAGSLLKSLAGILDHPSNILNELGDSLPTMAGYFVALLVTKILAGLPMIFLRFGALSRMLFLKTLSNEKKLTQRELDAVYRLENVQYGWEFPTQLLVVVIVFTYAVICPVILPVGFCYFFGALIVYKKQVLFVYSPVYESGGAMFPIAVQRTLFGLVCGQLTFIGYLTVRKCYYEPIALFPLPIITVYCMNFFYKTYAEPSTRLSLERAREHDRLTSLQENRTSMQPPPMGGVVEDRGIEARRRKFDKDAYRQPVLTEMAAEPWTYRRGVEDVETLNVRNQLREVNRYSTLDVRQSAMSGSGAGERLAVEPPPTTKRPQHR